MSARDRIITALTPGTPFNSSGLVWRSVDALSRFAGLDPDQTLEILAGDLAEEVAVRPSKTNAGLLAALKAQIPQAADPGDDVQVAVAGGPAFNAPAEQEQAVGEAPGEEEEDLGLEGMDPEAPLMD